MVTISLCMIVKNEEDTLARCLESAADLVDEIIIVDTGSSDRTKEIAGRYTPLVFDFPWCDDFSAARNFSFSKATMDYCLWLDADDVIEEKAAFLELKSTLSPSTDVVMMKYHIAFDQQGNPTYSYYRERLIKNHVGFIWSGAVHEVITPSGSIVYSGVGISHRKIHPSDPDRNLSIFEKLIQNGKTLEPREQFYYGRELYYHSMYRQAADVFRTLLDSGRGWVENNINACQLLAYCYFELGEEENGLFSLFRSFSYDSPRAEICCDIGLYFFNHGRYETAIFWYLTAASRPKDYSSGAFIQSDCYGYIPYLQICVCYDRLGNLEQARHYNTLAGKCKPNDPAVEQNERYFSWKMA